MNMLEVGDIVKVVINNESWNSTLKEKVGIFWKLDMNHPKDCCNYWVEEKIILIKKK